MPKYTSRFYHPYFTPQEIELLSEKQRGKLTATQEEKVRQSACTFIENVAARVGLWVPIFKVFDLLCKGSRSWIFGQPKTNDCYFTNVVPSFSFVLRQERFPVPCKLTSYSTHNSLTYVNLLKDVSLAAMFVSAKMHDTLKKPRELLAVSYGIRFPDLAAKSKHHGGDVDLDTMDPAVGQVSFCPSTIPS